MACVLFFIGCSASTATSPRAALEAVHHQVRGAASGVREAATGINAQVAALGRLGLPAGSEPYTEAIGGHTRDLLSKADSLDKVTAPAIVKAADQSDALLKRAERAEAKNRDWFTRAVRTVAVGAILLSVASGGLAAFLLISGNVKGATYCGILSGVLVGCAAALFVIADYWPWIVGGVLVCGVSFLGYLIFTAVRGWRARKALGVVVRAVEEADPQAVTIKPRIASIAGDDLSSIKSTISGIKAEIAHG